MADFSRFDLGALHGYEAKAEKLSEAEAEWCMKFSELMRERPFRLGLLATPDGDLLAYDKDAAEDLKDDHLLSSFFGSGVVLANVSSLAVWSVEE